MPVPKRIFTKQEAIYILLLQTDGIFLQMLGYNYILQSN